MKSPQKCRCFNKRVCRVTAVARCKALGGCKWLKNQCLRGSSVKKDHENKEKQRGEPLESVCSVQVRLADQARYQHGT